MGFGLAGAIIAVLAPVAVPAAFGEDFRPSVGLLQGLLLAIPGMTLASLMASQWIGRGLFWQSSVLTVLVGITNVTLCLALVPSRGASGAVVATVVSYTLAFIVNGAMAARCERDFRSRRGYAPNVHAAPEGRRG
jgi:O-antigen/teichoic acid export membrane protein